MFSIEAVGITENTLSSYDYQKIQEFKNSISFQDGSYNISIPWDEEKVNLVSSNHAISLKVLDRVNGSLTKSGVLNLYTEFFFGTEKGGNHWEIQCLSWTIWQLYLDPSLPGD